MFEKWVVTAVCYTKFVAITIFFGSIEIYSLVHVQILFSVKHILHPGYEIVYTRFTVKLKEKFVIFDLTWYTISVQFGNFTCTWLMTNSYYLHNLRKEHLHYCLHFKTSKIVKVDKQHLAKISF
ncbi:unnamed protein product [Ilex paraguariensis]|uniref:Uncharacterized protein n=1 Tax=Ilex paraguariensis TaxID=185542 RepID=A0ABC8RXY9_9AQUA